jgi:hypothetical protein
MAIPVIKPVQRTLFNRIIDKDTVKPSEGGRLKV